MQIWLIVPAEEEGRGEIERDPTFCPFVVRGADAATFGGWVLDILPREIGFPCTCGTDEWTRLTTMRTGRTLVADGIDLFRLLLIYFGDELKKV